MMPRTRTAVTPYWNSSWTAVPNEETQGLTPHDRDLHQHQERWGPYSIVDRIGSGGAGDVFSARAPGSNRLLALKICRDETPTAIDRFKREFRTLRSLQDLPVGRAFALSRYDGLWGFSLQYCRGKHPIEYCRGQRETGMPPSWPEALQTMRDMAAVLTRVHRAGVTHGDVKPGNILVHPKGHVRLLDFGLSCRESLGDRVVHPLAGAGTFQFLAPEVLEGMFGMPADVYALGRTFFLMVAGRLPSIDPHRLPKDSRGRLETIGEQEYRRRLKAQLPDGVPESLVELLVAMLAFHPDERPTAARVVEQLGGGELEALPEMPADSTDRWMESIRRAARRAASGKWSHTKGNWTASVLPNLVGRSVSGLFQELPWLLTQEVDCRREHLPLRAFDAALSTIRIWGERLPEPIRAQLPLQGNPAISLINGDFSVLNRPGLIDGALSLLRAATRSRLLIVPIRDWRYADPLSRQMMQRLQAAPWRRRILFLFASHAESKSPDVSAPTTTSSHQAL